MRTKEKEIDGILWTINLLKESKTTEAQFEVYGTGTKKFSGNKWKDRTGEKIFDGGYESSLPTLVMDMVTGGFNIEEIRYVAETGAGMETPYDELATK